MVDGSRLNFPAKISWLFKCSINTKNHLISLQTFTSTHSLEKSIKKFGTHLSKLKVCVGLLLARLVGWLVGCAPCRTTATVGVTGGRARPRPHTGGRLRPLVPADTHALHLALSSAANFGPFSEASATIRLNLQQQQVVLYIVHSLGRVGSKKCVCFTISCLGTTLDAFVRQWLQ